MVKFRVWLKEDGEDAARDVEVKCGQPTPAEAAALWCELEHVDAGWEWMRANEPMEIMVRNEAGALFQVDIVMEYTPSFYAERVEPAAKGEG